jgi:hypothetical protein
MSGPHPIAWLLFNTHTGKPASPVKAYVSHGAAMTAAERETNQWRKIVAVPVYLHPRERDES